MGKTNTRLWSVVLGVAASVSVFACAGSVEAPTDDAAATTVCQPEIASASGQEVLPEGRRGEALVEYLTGVVLQDLPEGVDIAYDNSNYGGVWGDFKGGWVVAVLDCSQVDLAEIARLAGGPDLVTIIEVPHSFEQVNDFRDKLRAELQLNGIPGDLPIDSTLAGRTITVVVEDLNLLPDDFGANVPSTAFIIEEGPLSQKANE